MTGSRSASSGFPAKATVFCERCTVAVQHRPHRSKLRNQDDGHGQRRHTIHGRVLCHPLRLDAVRKSKLADDIIDSRSSQGPLYALQQKICLLCCAVLYCTTVEGFISVAVRSIGTLYCTINSGTHLWSKGGLAVSSACTACIFATTKVKDY
jgi:hypothetical protein